MAQNSPQFCAKCGAALPQGQKFCTNCGATMGENVNSPTELASNPSNSNPSGPSAWSAPNIPPPPPGAAGPSTPNINPTVLAPPHKNDPYATRQDGPPPPPPFTSYPNNTPGAPAYPNPGNSAPGYANPANSAPGTYPNPGNSGPGFPAYPNPANRVQGYNPPQPLPMNPAQVPAYAQKPKRSNGCLLTSIILLVILAAGIGGFILVYSHFFNGKSSNSSANNGSSSTNNSGSSSASGVNTPIPTVSSTEQLNFSLVFASVNLTILSAQEAQSFADDTGSGQGAIVRVNLKESNTTASNPDYLEADALLLVLPDGSTITSGNQQQDISPGAGITRANWVDFAVSQQIPLAQLVLRLGTAKQSQMDIPLKPGADLSKYQDKTATPNSTFQYSGLTWTLKTAILSYSYADQQATTGNSYVIITLAVVNSSPNNFENNPGDYIRLQAGGASSEPDDTTTFPLSVPTATNASGVFAFLVPQGSTSFTLVMLAQDSSPAVPQVTQTFQIQ